MSAKELLRDHAADKSDRVGFVELFFDLVFVFAATQLSHRLVTDGSPVRIFETAIMFLAVWSVWTATTWVTNWLDVERNTVRLLLFALMIGGLFQALAIPDAFKSEVDAGAFAAVHVAMQVGRSLFVAFSVRGQARFGRHFSRVLVWYAVAAPLWFAGAWRPDEEQIAWWSAAIILEFVAPVVRYWVPGWGVSRTADYHVEPNHFAERCGLFIIIALGEVILITGNTVGELTRDAATTIAFLTALVSAMAMWWIYFSYSAEKGTQAVEKAKDPGRVTRIVFNYLHVVLIARLLVSAAGNEPLVTHPLDPAKGKELALIVGGAALFLAGATAVKRFVCGAIMQSHVAGMLALGVLGATAKGTPIGQVAMAAAAVLVAVAVWEELAIRADRRRKGESETKDAEQTVEFAEQS